MSSGRIALPTFTTKVGTSLIEALEALGMGSAFCPTGNLSGMAPGACLSHVMQPTVIEVDTGTTAAQRPF